MPTTSAICRRSSGAQPSVAVVFRDDSGGPCDRFVEQRFQPCRRAFPRLIRPAVGAHDRAELDVLQIDVVYPHRRATANSLSKCSLCR